MGLLADAIARRSLAREEVFDLARQERFTGSVTFHFRGGLPRQVAIGAPLQAEIVEKDALENVFQADSPVGRYLTSR